MMSISVLALFLNIFPDKFNSFVVVKLQNVKSVSKAVKGNEPVWEKEFVLYVISKHFSPNCYLKL